ncbi:hypothetical protein AAMO2058_000518900 [Amorphochlora amoebiformis]
MGIGEGLGLTDQDRRNIRERLAMLKRPRIPDGWREALPYPWERAIDHDKSIYCFYNPKTCEVSEKFPVEQPEYDNQTIIGHDIPAGSQFFFYEGFLRPEVKRNAKFYFGNDTSTVHRVYATIKLGEGEYGLWKVVFQPDTKRFIPLETLFNVTNAIDEKDMKDAEQSRLNNELGPIVVQTVVGTGRVGCQDSRDPQNATFFRPTGIAFGNADESVIVADTANHQIRYVSTRQPGVYSVAGGAGKEGYRDGSVSSSLFSLPFGVGVDLGYNIIVADTQNHVIRKIFRSNRTVITWAGYKSQGRNDTNITNRSQDGLGTKARFQFPSAIVSMGDGSFIVADKFSFKLRKIDPTGNVTTIAGNGNVDTTDGMSSTASLGLVDSVAFNPTTGDIYCASSFEDHRIRKISPNGNVTTFAGSLAGGLVDGAASGAQFEMIRSMSVDPQNGNLYVAESLSNRIRRISPSLQVVTYGGDGYVRGGWRDGAASKARFDQPFGVCVDRFGRVFVADTTNNKIRVIQIPNQRAERISSTEFRLLDDEKLTFRVGDTEYDPENIPSLGPRKQGYGFIRPGEEVNLFHEEDQTYEIVKVVECDVNTIRGRTSVQLTDEFGRTALQLVEDSLLHPRNYTAFANARSRNIDDIGTKWNGVMPTKMPTNPRILGPQDMEMYTREYLDEDWMQSQRLGDSAEHAPLAANRRHSFKGQVLDFWGDPVKDPLTESAKPEVYRIPDPFMTYVYGTVDYPPPEKLGKETEDPFVYEEQFNVQGGQIHATEAELDPDKYADIIEEHAKNHPYLRLGWSEMTDRPDELQKKSMLPPIPKSLPIDSIVDLYKV